MTKLSNLLAENEEWLIKRILLYAIERDYSKYTSSLEEAWRMSIVGISESIIEKYKLDTSVPELHPDENYEDDPITAFGVLEAKKHRERGINLSMFLGLLKYYKQSYLDLLNETDNKNYSLFIERCFDRIEIAFCSEWSKTPEEEKLRELQEKSREIINEKNSYLSAFESISDPVILLDEDFRIANLNLAAAKLLNSSATPGMEYYFDALSKRKNISELKNELYGDAVELIGEEILKIFPWLNKVLDSIPTFPFFHRTFYCETQMDGVYKVFEVKFSKMLDVSHKFMPFIITLRDITEERRAHEDLEKSEESFRSIIEQAPLSIMITDHSGTILQLNQKFIELFGLTQNDLTHIEQWWEAAYPSEAYRDYVKSDWNNRINKAIANQTSIAPAERIVTLANRPQKIIQFFATATPDKLIVFFNDLTEMRRIEDDLEKIFNLSVDLFCVANLEGQFVRINPAAEKILGYSKEELLGQPFLNFIHPDDLQKTIDVIANELKKGKTVVNFENRYICKDGSVKWLEWVSQPMPDMNLTFAVARDMTERKKYEDEIHNQKLLFETMFNAISDGIIITDTERNIILANKGMETVFGYSTKELIGNKSQMIYAVEKKYEEAGAKYFRKQAETKSNLYNMLYKDKSGREFPGETFGGKLFDSKGEWIGNLGVIRDITDREEAEFALRESEERYRLLFENMTSGFALHEMIYDENNKPVDYRYLEINPAFERLTGINSSALLGKTVKEILPTNEDYWINNYAKVVESGEPIHFENYSADLGKYYDTYSFTPQKGQFAVMFHDVTERKNAETALKESEERFSKVFHLNPSMIGVHKLIDGKYIDVNEAMCTLLGYSREELIGYSPSELGIISEGEKIYYYETLEKDGLIKDYETIVRTKSGTELMVLLSVVVVNLKDETYFYTITQDITNRKIAENALRASRRMLAAVLDTIPVRVFWKDTDLRYMGCNSNFARDVGFSSHKHIIGKTDYELCWKAEEADNYRKKDIRIMESGSSHLYYEEVRNRPNGERFWTLTSKIPLKDENNSVYGILGCYEDITERKLAEQELHDIYDLNEKVISNSPIGLIVYDENGQCVTVNKEATKIIGATTEEVLKQNFRKIDSWKKSGLLEKAEKALSTGEEQSIEVFIKSTFD